MSYVSVGAAIAALLSALLTWYFGGVPRPGRVSVRSKRNISMSTFGIVFALPAPSVPSDVASRELTVKTDGAPDVVKTYAGPATASDELTFNLNDSIHATLVDIDAAGNRSAPSPSFDYKVVDDVPPTQPGQIGIASKKQLS